jgi:hypothetical protein
MLFTINYYIFQASSTYSVYCTTDNGSKSVSFIVVTIAYRTIVIDTAMPIIRGTWFICSFDKSWTKV